jgi:tetratricopeptide (TPR) repeat protein
LTAIEYLILAELEFQRKQYAMALDVISRAELEEKACPEMLVLKGACIQLASETDFPVERAIEIYDSAISAQPRNARALLGKGFFLLNVMDDAAAARPSFKQAAGILGQDLEQALHGLVMSARETGIDREAAEIEVERYLQELLHSVLASSRRSG